jgi:hypothetical protein
MDLLRRCTLLLFLGLCAGAPVIAIGAEADTATESLQAAYVRLGPDLRSNPFGKPLVMRSEEGQGSIQGEVYAVVNFTLEQLNAAVATPAHWCDVMILHINTKFCRVSESADGPVLSVDIGKNTPQELADTSRLDFKFKTQSTATGAFKTTLTALHGPMGTSNYQIVLEAVGLEGGTSFLHLAYSYDFNVVSRVALGVYLSTIGRDKVGFTLTNTATTAAPVYIQGLRALVERNTMRYFLAINAYLESAHGPEDARLDARLHNWFSATETYPRQLREVDWKDYLAMKHAEVLRQQKLPPQ